MSVCLLQAVYSVCVCGSQVWGVWWESFLLFPPRPGKKEAGQTSRVFMSDSVRASCSVLGGGAVGERTAGVSWQNNSYYEMLGLHFNSGRPCQGHHMPARLPGLLETRCYWTKAAALERHTQQLFSATAHHLMTLMEGRATHDWKASFTEGETAPARPQILNTCNNTRVDRREGPADVSVPFIFAFSLKSFNALRRVTNKQINKAATSSLNLQSWTGGGGWGGIFFQSRAARKLSQTSVNT